MRKKITQRFLKGLMAVALILAGMSLLLLYVVGLHVILESDALGKVLYALLYLSTSISILSYFSLRQIYGRKLF